MDPFTTTGLIALGKLIFGKAAISSAAATFGATATAVGVGTVLAGAIGTLVYISYLTLSHLVKWFKSKSHYKNRTNRACSLKAQLKGGKRVIVQGIFEPDGDPVSPNAVRTVEYDSISDEVQNLHEDYIVEYT